jgi:hypothetical protein
MSKRLFRADQADLIAELMKIVINFRYKTPLNPDSAKDMFKSYGKGNEGTKAQYKPTFADLLSPDSLYLDFWNYYLTNLFLHGKLSKKSNKWINTKLKRRTEIKRLKKILGYKPSSRDLRKAFELPEKFDEICKVIDGDIKKLTQKKRKDVATGNLRHFVF